MSPQDGLETALNFYENNLNNKVVFKDFLSCHTDNVRLSDKELAFQFVIKTSSKSKTKDIQQVTFIQNEREVLFPNNIEFIIQQVNRDTNQVTIAEV